MPSIRPKGHEAEPRSTFRPPWVKDGPRPLPAPPPSWVGNRIPQQETAQKGQSLATPTLKKTQSEETKGVKEKTIPIEMENKESGIQQKEVSTHIPNKSPVKIESRPKQKLTSEGELMENSKLKQAGKKTSVKIVDPESRKTEKETPIGLKKGERREDHLQKPEIDKNAVTSSEPQPPPPPPLPFPKPPPLPGVKQKPMSETTKQKLEALRSRPRKRPDWTDMMKEVETGIKLNHVQCNDRSAPVIPKTKARGQFVYESEKHNAHNLLLKEIQSGVHLKKVKTNDRSKPILDGLRKFRRQMTIEEQIQKSASVADVIAVAAEPDELDDIDKVRDDLQSTKQMLALEMRNKEALERENKRLMARLFNLEAELEKEKLSRKIHEESQVVHVRTDEDEQLITKLKEEAAESAKMAKEIEDQYHKTAEELDLTRAKLESSWLRNSQLEMELKSKGKAELVKQRSIKKMPSVISQDIIDTTNNDLSEESDTDTEEGDFEEEENGQTSNISHEERQYNLLLLKVENFKQKRLTASREKKNLKVQLNKLQAVLKEEKKRYRMLQSEVEKMASIMRDVEEGSESEGQQSEEEIEDDEEDEEETESDSSAETESDSELDPDLSLEGKIKILEKRVKEHETFLNRAKKANYLLKANIDRRQDDLNRQKEMSLVLQEDLNAVLSELG